jgi:HD-GYP domain-containing protein (c-di-GMP phosphodiesterase class II)
MIQILLVESDIKTSAFLKLNMMKSIGCAVYEANSSAEALSFLQRNSVQLVVCRKSEARKFQHIPLVEMKLEDSWKNIVLQAGKTLGVDVNFTGNKIQSEYIPVSINYFNIIPAFTLESDIYIRVKKSGSASHFVKRFHSGEKFLQEEIERYKEMGLTEFYITKEQFSHFVNYVTEKLIGEMAESKVERQAKAYEITIDRIHSLGIDELTVELVEESIIAMEKTVKGNDALADFIKKLKSEKLSFAFAHSYFCCLILHKIVDQFQWDSVKMKERLTYVSYFHDISLEVSNLMEINSESDFEDTKLTEPQKKLVLNHALESANIVDRFPKIPMGIGTILKEHHGSKSGIGFPETLSISIAPLSMMFIVVEHFVIEFLKLEDPVNEDLIGIITKLSERYNKVTYLQTLKAIESMIQKQNRKAS